jgi:predicted nucleic acid-binding protein
MILADTSVWIGHFRSGDAELSRLLDGTQIMTHPHVIGELALGGLPARSAAINLLLKAPSAILASDADVLDLIQREKLAGSGVGYVDCHLLASTRLTPGARLWTHDRGLDALARRLGVAKAPVRR